MKNLTTFKFEPTTLNMSQHVAKGWPNVRNMLRPTMLRYAALKCCDRLAGALVLNFTLREFARTELIVNLTFSYVRALISFFEKFRAFLIQETVNALLLFVPGILLIHLIFQNFRETRKRCNFVEKIKPLLTNG